MLDYLTPNNEQLSISRSNLKNPKFNKSLILDAIHHAHEVIDKFSDFGVDVFSILGMRNLSAFIGELFAASLENISSGLFVKNPHQDGYPDLLLLDDIGKKHWESLKDRIQEKEPFSPYKYGGIEIKSTCGSVPTPAACAKKGFVKPHIGDQRIHCLKSYDWKAHHRETNNLVGIVWDFIDSLPRITAVFYSSELEESDWGKIVQPKEGGGRTTSVSIMPRKAVKKMYKGWQFVFNSPQYIDFFDRYNKDTLLFDHVNNNS